MTTPTKDGRKVKIMKASHGSNISILNQITHFRFPNHVSLAH